jgi:predicted transcriptional regulator
MGPQAEAVLDLAARRRIVEHVREHPGLHLRALAEALAMPVSTLEYHCYHLVRHGHLTTREEGAFKAFYPAEGLDRRDKDILYLVRHEAPRRICTFLLLNPGATPGDLKPATGLSGPTLSFHLAKLRKAALLREEPAGRTKRLFIEDPERVASVLVTYRRSFVDDAVDRFSEAWLALAPPERKDKEKEGERGPAAERGAGGMEPPQA